jgi:hypothetical protein
MNAPEREAQQAQATASRHLPGLRVPDLHRRQITCTASNVAGISCAQNRQICQCWPTCLS